MTGLGGDSFWLCWDARAARLTALQAAGAAAARATPDLYRRHGLDSDPGPGAPGRAHGARGSRRPLDRAPLQPGAPRLDDALGRSPPGRDPARGRRHARLALPVACHGAGHRSAAGRGARLRAVPRDLSGRRRRARAGPEAGPAPPGAHARAARPRGRPRVLRGGPRGRDRTGVRGAGEPAPPAGPRGAPVALGRARHRSVSRRRRRLGPAALPGSGRARGPGDARRYRRPGARPDSGRLRPPRSSRPRSWPSATATGGWPIRSTWRCRSGVSSIRPTSGSAAG